MHEMSVFVDMMLNGLSILLWRDFFKNPMQTLNQFNSVLTWTANLTKKIERDNILSKILKCIVVSNSYSGLSVSFWDFSFQIFSIYTIVLMMLRWAEFQCVDVQPIESIYYLALLFISFCLASFSPILFSLFQIF